MVAVESSRVYSKVSYTYSMVSYLLICLLSGVPILDLSIPSLVTLNCLLFCISLSLILFPCHFNCLSICQSANCCCPSLSDSLFLPVSMSAFLLGYALCLVQLFNFPLQGIWQFITRNLQHTPYSVYWLLL